MDEARTWRIDAGDSVSQSASPTSRRVAELDGLRGLAALAIVLFHVRPTWLPGGWLAVDLFFVLSGFLITSILIEHGDRPGFLRAFYIRRGLRIWPIYVFTILTLAALSSWLPSRCRWSGFWTTLTYTQFVPLDWGGKAKLFSIYLPHTWTLAIEEQFYLIWPLLALAVGRRRIAWVALLLVLASSVLRAQGWAFMTLLGRLDGLAMGGVLAAVCHARPRWMDRALIAALVVGPLGMACLVAAGGPIQPFLPLSWPGLWVTLFNLSAFGLVGLLASRSGARHLAPLRFSLLTYFGKISYGIYLYHVVILFWVMDLCRAKRFHEIPTTALLPALGLCLACSAISWRYIEQPLLRFKSRAEYQRSEPGSSRVVREPSRVEPGAN